MLLKVLEELCPGKTEDGTRKGLLGSMEMRLYYYWWRGGARVKE